jgi:beta-phosphoglucomutase
MIKAILFDMDGVISDTDRTRFNLLKKLLSKRGFKLREKDYKKSVGLRTKVFLKNIFGDKIDGKELEKIFIARKKELHDHPKKYITEQPNVKKLIKNLYQDGYVLAVASSSIKKDIELILKILKLQKYFKLVQGSDDTKHPKPHPEIYTKCCKKLKLKPKECLAIEDSPTGIESAKAAGCYCVAVTFTHDKKYLQRADIVVSNILKISALTKLSLIKS